ncbi:hypothetical protein [Chitinophaga sp. 212800010-3]|uniref:alpha-L-rhamnosidase-related protein n=1 Tax=unclassified Chitinophaga TaxID=2619133 RepID=UPI002DEF9886|nr:Bac-rhamnosid6H domain-containing protein [Chitinophaga sp. 212800010-3]
MRSIPVILVLALLPILSLGKNGSRRVTGQIVHDRVDKKITIATATGKLGLVIDYSRGCRITALNVNGKNTVEISGIFTAIQTAAETFDSRGEMKDLKVMRQGNRLVLSGISYGDVTESWQFSAENDKIRWTISRTYGRDLALEDMAMPLWNFTSDSTWEGGILDNGGMVWCKYFRPYDTYGVHTGGVTFWNRGSGDGLRISAEADCSRPLAAKYSRNEDGEFTCAHLVTDTELGQRYGLSRFVAGKHDVFAPFWVRRETLKVSYTLEYIDYFKEYDRGTLQGIDAAAVRELLNTTGRYGVVDNRIVGGNGWLTNWKCLHEPFFAQIGLALNDGHYTKSLSATLDQERDLAMREDGRVLSRWHNVPGDEIPGTYNKTTGYYEAMWGYTIDSQTGYVINTAEQFQQTGDIAWLRSHKRSCEKALDWLIRRDSNGNGIFEMMNNYTSEQKASDWIDIVWASFENAFVNAQLYEALNLWSDCGRVLGDTVKATYYSEVARRLKTAFNRNVEDGGFWSPEKKQYVYWRDRDGAVHGDNLVTPVNFAAIAFGICDDSERIAIILNNIEQRTAAEGLFHWPLCFDSFRKEEVDAGNWPFPKYENGDIFPTWGYLGIRSYVKYDKDLALKYIRNILAQYRKDGLSSQRYSRADQSGQGSDVLAGISTTVTALYSDVYGIRPKWNRMGLEPNMVPALNGTRFWYTLRDTVYEITLHVGDYRMKTTRFSVKSSEAFGVGRSGNDLVFFPGNKEHCRLVVLAGRNDFTRLEVDRWEANACRWTVESGNNHRFRIYGLRPGAKYQLAVNGQRRELQTATDGMLIINTGVSGPATFVLSLI